MPRPSTVTTANKQTDPGSSGIPVPELDLEVAAQPQGGRRRRPAAQEHEWDVDEYMHPDRLWLLAQSHRELDRLPRDLIEQHPDVAWAHRLAVAVAGGMAPGSQIPGELQPASAALEIYQQDPPVRALLEALILGDADIETISQATEVPGGVVQAYERLFFDMRPLLRYPAFVSTYIRELENDPRVGPLRRLLLGIAHAGGAELVEVFCDPERTPTAEQTRILLHMSRRMLQEQQLRQASRPRSQVRIESSSIFPHFPAPIGQVVATTPCFARLSASFSPSTMCIHASLGAAFNSGRR